MPRWCIYLLSIKVCSLSTSSLEMSSTCLVLWCSAISVNTYIVVIITNKQHSKWRHKHPRYNKADPYYLLTRWEQVTVFRLRTGHNRLNYHLYSKLRIGHTEQCPCGTGSQTTEHLLQSCPTYEPLRKGIWPDHAPVAHKLCGSLRDLRCAATFIEETGISI